MTFAAGKQIGRYELIKLIGSGGIASVYQAFDPLFDRDVAIKLMHPPFLIQEEFRKRFLREAQATARLRQLGIIETLDYGETADHQLYLVMELVQGPNLEQVLTQWREARRQVPLPEAMRLMGQLAEAVAFANEHGVLHRDLKPANILLKPRQPAYSGELLTYDPLITDFGLARLEGGADVTQPGVSIGGTPAYMAPEQLGNEPLDERCDLYSLGVIFYELVTGQLPFQLKTLQDALRQHALNSLPLRMPKELRPDLPDALNTLISHAINPIHSHRLPSARTLAQALTELGTNLPGNRVTPAPMIHDATVPDLRLPDVTVPAVRLPNSNLPDPDLTIPAFHAADSPSASRPLPQRTAPRDAQSAKPSGKTDPRRATPDPNLTLGTDPALTLVTPQPARRNVAAVVLTTTMVIIAAVLTWYFTTRLQSANNVPNATATPATSQVAAADTPTVAPTDEPTIEPTTTADASAAITQTIDTPVASATTMVTEPVTETVTDTVPAVTNEPIVPTQTITATVIGADTSHPTQLWIDGDSTDWQVLRALSKSQMTLLDAYIEGQDSADCQASDPNATAAVDLGAQLQFAYDATNLYVSFLIQDDEFVTNAEPTQYAQGDATQLLIKMSLTGEAAASSEDEYQINFLPGIELAGDRPALSMSKVATPTDFLAIPDGRVAAASTSSGYFVEAALPWSAIGVTSPQAGQILGIVANVSDNDTPSAPQQECLLSVVPNFDRTSPQHWAALVLE